MTEKITPYDWQVEKMIIPLYNIFQRRQSAMCCGCCGSGKTVVGLDLARRLNLLPFVIAPKVALPSWRATAEAMGIVMVDVLNLEKLKTGNTRYLKKNGERFTWYLERDKIFVIWDEAHGACGHKTLNSYIAGALWQPVLWKGEAINYQPKSLFMSATLGESPIKFGGPLGKVLGLHGSGQYDGLDWMKAHGCYLEERRGIQFPTGESRKPHLKRLHEELYPAMGVHLKHADIPGFPENQIITEMVTIKPKELKDLQSAYDDIEALDRYERTRDVALGKDENPLTMRIRARQMSELAKIPAIVELTNNLIQEGGSVIIFLDFRPTLDILLQKLRKYNPAVIRGQQKLTTTFNEREVERVRFVADKTRVCLCAIKAGGQSCDLNDQHGLYQRYSIMSPPQSALDYTQALGRAWRINSMSPSIQYMLLAQGTVEEKIAKQLETKLTNLDLIHDSDFY